MFDTISTDLEGISNNAHKSRFLIAAGTQAHFVSSICLQVSSRASRQSPKRTRSIHLRLAGRTTLQLPAKSNSPVAEEFANHVVVSRGRYAVRLIICAVDSLVPETVMSKSALRLTNPTRFLGLSHLLCSSCPATRPHCIMSIRFARVHAPLVP